MATKFAFDFSLLRKRIVEMVGTNGKMAEELGITEISFSRKMTGKVLFSMNDIMRMVEILEIDPNEIGTYFFMPKELNN